MKQEGRKSCCGVGGRGRKPKESKKEIQKERTDRIFKETKRHTKKIERTKERKQ